MNTKTLNKTALITGINGMDGSHLADFLLTKGYKIFGMERRSSVPNRKNTKHLEGKITFMNGDLTDQNSLFIPTSPPTTHNFLFRFIQSTVKKNLTDLEEAPTQKIKKKLMKVRKHDWAQQPRTMINKQQQRSAM